MYKYNLRITCMAFGAVSFGVHIGSFIYTSNPDFLTIVMLTVGMVIGLALFLGALFENEIIVLVTLILKLFDFLYTVIVFVGLIFDFGDFRDKEVSDDVAVMVIFGSVRNVICLFVIYVIYIYYKELRNSEDD